MATAGAAGRPRAFIGLVERRRTWRSSYKDVDEDGSSYECSSAPSEKAVRCQVPRKGTVAEMGGVFISYRREDSGPYAGRLRDALSNHFGPNQVFRDIDRIRPGERFPRVIEQAVASCDALLAVIGPTWLSVEDENGRRRLLDPNDYLRQEIAAALKRDDVKVIPVLIGSAQMPARRDLPQSLAALADHHAVRMSDEGWEDQVPRLIRELEQVVDRASPTPSYEDPPPSIAHRATPRQPISDQSPSWRPPTVAPRPEPSPRSPVPSGPVVVAIAVLLVGGLGFAAAKMLPRSTAGVEPSSPPPGARVGDGSPDAGVTGCVITTTNPLATTHEKPDSFSQEVVRLPPGSYRVEDIRTTTFVNEPQRWFLVAADARSGWLEDTTFNIDSRSVDCP